jgi:hypothetical protein
MAVPKLIASRSTFLKDNWKPIIGIGAAIGVAFVGYQIYQALTPPAGGIDTDPRFSKSDLTDAEAKMKADRLFGAMRTLGNVNEQELKVIKDVFQGMTYNDYVKIHQAFGERRYVEITGVGGIWPADLRDLTFWLSKELAPADLNVLKKVLPNVF